MTDGESKSGPAGLIAKAKAAISKVPVADTDEIEGGAEAETAPADVPEMAADTAEAVDPAPILSSGRDAVSQFLSSAHIGGVRKGDRPMILLNGEAFNRGDLVDEATGLKFEGFRDGKIAFRGADGVVYVKSF